MPLRSLITACLVLASLAIPTSAGAATLEDCQARIAALRADTASVTSFANAKDQSGLLGKLDNAAASLSAGKNAGAVQKLTDFRTKVQTLGSNGKLGADDATRLDAEAADAIGCIGSLET